MVDRACTLPDSVSWAKVENSNAGSRSTSICFFIRQTRKLAPGSTLRFQFWVFEAQENGTKPSRRQTGFTCLHLTAPPKKQKQQQQNVITPKATISLGCDEFAMGLRIDSQNRRETVAWYRKGLACIANSSRTVRQSFKHVILFCATKIIAKPSRSHHMCREPVANPSRTSHEPIAAKFSRATMRQNCDMNKNVLRTNGDIIKTVSRQYCDKLN